MAAPSQPALDHIILLVPYSHISKLPAFFTDNFTISPGGRHADGKTENVLIILQSGLYLELIAFIDDKPSNREGHWWGKKSYGWIDWALTSNDVKDVETVRERLRNDSTVRYDSSITGGRTKPDGTHIEWQLTFPSSAAERGSVPFFTRDLTPRDLRVPVHKGATRHPCGATGISSIRLVTRESNVDRLVGIYKELLGSESYQQKDANGWHYFTIGQPADAHTSSIIISPAQSPSEEALLTDHGHSAKLTEVSLRVGEDIKPPPRHVEDIDGSKVAFGFGN